MDHSLSMDQIPSRSDDGIPSETADHLVVLFDVRASEELLGAEGTRRLKETCESAAPQPRAIVLTGVGTGSLRRELADWLSAWTPKHHCAVIILRDELPSVGESEINDLASDLGGEWARNSAVQATAELYMELFCNDAT